MSSFRGGTTTSTRSSSAVSSWPARLGQRGQLYTPDELSALKAMLGSRLVAHWRRFRAVRHQRIMPEHLGLSMQTRNGHCPRVSQGTQGARICAIAKWQCARVSIQLIPPADLRCRCGGCWRRCRGSCRSRGCGTRTNRIRRSPEPTTQAQRHNDGRFCALSCRSTLPRPAREKHAATSFPSLVLLRPLGMQSTKQVMHLPQCTPT